MSWNSLHNHSMYSLLDGRAKPIEMAERAASLGMKALALTDHGTLAGTMDFIDACEGMCACGHHKKDHMGNICVKCKCGAFDANPIKPIIGCEYYVCTDNSDICTPQNRKLSHLVVLAKNKEGWKDLIKLNNFGNTPGHYYYKPRFSLDELAELVGGRGNLIAISGHLGSEMANVLFSDIGAAYNQDNYENAKALVNMERLRGAVKLAEIHNDIFGKNNFFLESQKFDKVNQPAAEVAANAIDWIGKQTGIPVVATGDSHYASPEDFEDQRILLCSSMGTSLNEVNRKMAANEDVGLAGFFKSKNYYIQDPKDIERWHNESEVKASLLISDMCETYKLASKPLLANFPCPDGHSQDSYLVELCRNGMKELVKTNDNSVYQARLDYEISVMQEAGLSAYFLIVQDYCNAARSRGEILGPGRGSSVGSLIAYLTGITEVDPIIADLSFTRFYNKGRNTKDHISLPDIDTDFPVDHRQNTIEDIKSKYGVDCVNYMTTFGRIQGRGALREVFRVKFPGVPFDELGRITACIPDEAKIADELQTMREAGEDPSIIMWALEHNKKELKDFCYIDDRGALQGEYAPAFDQAIRLEGVKKSQGKHPSGIVISPYPLAEICPMVYDKGTKSTIIGFEMGPAEKIGLTKYDLLGLALQSKLMLAQSLLATGKLK